LSDHSCTPTESTTTAAIATSGRVQSRPLVEVLYFDGCPNHEPAVALVERVAAELGLQAEIRLVHVPDADAAARLRFLGSPTIRVGGQLIEAPAASFVYGPRGIPHTFTVTSPEARFLLVTEPAGFEGFMRALSEPAQSLTLPPATTPSPDPERMTAIATEYGIEILGPPGIPT